MKCARLLRVIFMVSFVINACAMLSIHDQKAMNQIPKDTLTANQLADQAQEILNKGKAGYQCTVFRKAANLARRAIDLSQRVIHNAAASSSTKDKAKVALHKATYVMSKLEDSDCAELR
jgi:hypothetical protein